MIEQPWNDARLKMNGVYIGCVTKENADEIMGMQTEALRYRESKKCFRLPNTIEIALMLGGTAGIVVSIFMFANILAK